MVCIVLLPLSVSFFAWAKYDKRKKEREFENLKTQAKNTENLFNKKLKEIENILN